MQYGHPLFQELLSLHFSGLRQIIARDGYTLSGSPGDIALYLHDPNQQAVVSTGGERDTLRLFVNNNPKNPSVYDGLLQVGDENRQVQFNLDGRKAQSGLVSLDELAQSELNESDATSVLAHSGFRFGSDGTKLYQGGSRDILQFYVVGEKPSIIIDHAKVDQDTPYTVKITADGLLFEVHYAAKEGSFSCALYRQCDTPENLSLTPAEVRKVLGSND